MKQSRREFMRLLAAAPLAAQSGKKPNLVVILADDLGYGDLGCYGSKANRTPHVDRLAAEGIRFTDFYTPMPFCAPTRASLLTGRYPFRTTVTANPAPDGGSNDLGLPQSELTLAEILREAGYVSCCLGKWHLGHTPEFLPRTQGFDEYYGILYSNDMRPVQLVENERVVEYPVVQGKLTGMYTQRAISFIERNRERPFFLYLAHAMPHKPLAASEDYYSNGGTPEALYADVMRELDDSVGAILAKLRSAGLDESTLVIFTSDNGPWFGGSTGGLRAMKGSTFDGGVRVPMIARWPGRIAGGRVSQHVAGIIDICPTLVDAAGARLPTDRVIDGRSLLGLMTGTANVGPHEAEGLFILSGAELRAIRWGKWKLHVRPPAPGPAYLDEAEAAKWVDPRGPDGITLIAQYEQARPNSYPGLRTGDAPRPMMLFDMESDPGEQRDVAPHYPEVVTRLKKLFDVMEAQAPPAARIRRGGSGGIKRLKGGALRYDIELPRR